MSHCPQDAYFDGIREHAEFARFVESLTADDGKKPDGETPPASETPDE